MVRSGKKQQLQLDFELFTVLTAHDHFYLLQIVNGWLARREAWEECAKDVVVIVVGKHVIKKHIRNVRYIIWLMLVKIEIYPLFYVYL